MTLWRAKAVARACVVWLVVAMLGVTLTGCTDEPRTDSADSTESSTESAASTGACDPTLAASESESVARLWIEATLDAVRRDFPAPTVHSRNLWHLSAVMWDAFAAFTPGSRPYFDFATIDTGSRQLSPAEQTEAATTAISFAAHRLLSKRYEFAANAEESLAGFDALMAQLCHDTEATPETGSPAAVGLEIAESALGFGADDGSLERNRYIDISYAAVNPPLIVASDSIEMVDPNRWQPLQLADRVTQNGQSEGAGVQRFIGANWGFVTSFSLPDADDRGITIDPGPPPYLGTETAQEFVDAAVQVIGYSDLLGGAGGAAPIDISPGVRGDNTLGRADGAGHQVNPVTGEPYESNEVPHGDYGRAIAEFWADGPDSETPPGHWNTLAIEVTDLMPQEDLRWAGSGAPLSRLEWDLRLFFTLNASLHDTAIAVWGAKRAYDYPRPISMIRYLGSGNDGGLPPTPGLVEVVTEETGARGGRHVGLPVGSTVVRTWMGPVSDPESQVAGVGWRRAIDWIPYQRRTFVSPAFAGYTSGHSGFSRAAADILTEATGSAYFPNGMFTHVVPAGSLLHEEGPSIDVELQWATYQDAADEAGESRRYGGIHVEADDIAGRLMGAEVAALTWEQAQPYFG